MLLQSTTSVLIPPASLLLADMSVLASDWLSLVQGQMVTTTEAHSSNIQTNASANTQAFFLVVVLTGVLAARACK